MPYETIRQRPALTRKRLTRASAVAGLALTAALAVSSSAAAADPAPFELDGPRIDIEVTRGKQTLPIAQVPSLSEGDKLVIRSAVGPDQGAHFILVSAFLRGATNPPPKDWVQFTETWQKKDKKHTLDVTVPKGARQMVLLMVPDTGGAEGVLRDSVRGKPGEFVRVGQELNQASLDHSRLEAFMAAIRAQGDYQPEALQKIAPVLASSLSIKLNADCLSKVAQEQASCLLQSPDTLVLSDVHSSSLADTLTDTPTDLALQLSATPEGGAGYYSAYIGVARDLVRMLGAFSNPSFGYLPALTQRDGSTLSLLLNAAPSFNKPKSVMVAGMPAVEADVPPQLRSTAKGPICVATGDAVLPVEGAPLVFSTRFAHNVSLRVTGPDSKIIEIPVEARANRGGYVLPAGALPTGETGTLRGHLHGRWGFESFDGPDFQLQRPGTGAWKVVADTSDLVVGRDNTVEISGGAAGCVSDVTMQRGNGAPQPVKWTASAADGLSVTVPLTGAAPGPVHLSVRYRGDDNPSDLPLTARAESSRIDTITAYGNDGHILMTGQRLEQVKDVALGSLTFTPDGLTRNDNLDRLSLTAQGGAHVPAAGTSIDAQVHLTGGRSQTISVKVAAPRPQATIIGRTIRPAPQPAGTLPLEITGDDILPDAASLVFSLQAPEGMAFTSADTLEIAGTSDDVLARLSMGKGLTMASAQVLVGTLAPDDLPPSTFGPLRFRVVQAGIAGDWQPLATLARLPRIVSATCDAKAAKPACTITGQSLYLVDAVSTDAAFASASAVPVGYTGTALQSGIPADGVLHLRLRDAPKAQVSVKVDTAKP
ncbi:hypothetical protein [Novosphingobium sp. 9]|uniref:hypothetical protein n=1 Tax=Novosphingobium sp. 9 TaxID=2025349 RepID=UPI0021B61F5F|nr:hypothetical protein [Novosphingobium sp. 9]